MFKQSWMPVQFIVCIAMISSMTSGCWGPHGDHERPDRVGRGCPIPYGTELTPSPSAPFLEMYASHNPGLDTVRIDINARNKAATLRVGRWDGPLRANDWYELVFSNPPGGPQELSLVDERMKQTTSLGTDDRFPSLGDVNEGAKNPGMTIYEATPGVFHFGIRMNGESIPVKISQ